VTMEFMTTGGMPLNEVRVRGLRALKRELGVVGMSQFLRQYEVGHGDYSKERHAVLDKFDIDTLFNLAPSKRKKIRN